MYQENNSTQYSRLICEMDILERPREKAFAKGLDSLSDVELMAIIFATGIKGKSVVDMCREILDMNGGHLSVLAKKSAEEIMNDHKGIGKVKAITLLAALKLGERCTNDAISMMSKSAILDADHAYQMMRHHFQWLTHEEFWIIYLDRGGHIIREEKVSQGGTFATTVDVKIIMKSAIQSLANSMILFHNHPSGTLKPSAEDDKLTQRIKDCAALFNICIHDHIIVSDTGYYSYAYNQRL